MSLDDRKWYEQEINYPEVRNCIGKSTCMSNALPSYEYLFKLKESIPKELYAYYYRKLLQFNTANVSVELRLKMFTGVDRNDIMYQQEIDAICSLGDSVIGYRGTSKAEKQPGLSWSLKRYIAESSDFYNGRLFIARIPTSSILLYLMKQEDEEEVVAYVTSDYIIEDE